jgi:predicted AAA+ superfamily ATPase
MKRLINQSLNDWIHSKRRKPLILRGARQVGKTYAVKALAAEQFQQSFVCIDFEKTPRLANIFSHDLNPKRILSELELVTGQAIIPGKTLLFFDEIQQSPEALMSLRYFFEEIPDLHLIAAGSLLEFVLSDISFPVGRVQFLTIYPLSFIEYLMAIGRENLAVLLQEKPKVLSEAVHDVLRQELIRYFVIGGMPEAVQAFVDSGSIRESQAVHQELILSFQNDFAKYAPHSNRLCLSEVFSSVAKEVGNQIKYSHLAHDFSGPTIKNAFTLLSMAQVITPIPCCSPPMLPLEASAHMKTFKAAFLDIGLMQSLCGLPMDMQDLNKNLLSVYRGALAEQFVAQELRFTQDQGKLYYWQRLEKSSTAEVDFLAVKQSKVIPIEVKSGAAGRLRSLHLFLEQYPHIPSAYIFLDAPYQEPKDDRLIFMPLYFIHAAFL